MKDSDEPPELYLLGFFLVSMSGSLIISLVLLVFLLLASALVSGSEVAFFTLQKDDLNQMAESNPKHGARVKELRDRPRTLLGTILVANNFVNIGIVVLSEYIIWQFVSNELFNSWAEGIINFLGMEGADPGILARSINFLITVFGITFILVLFGEIAPKIYARIHYRAMSVLMSGPLKLLMRLFNPITSGLVALSNGLEHWLSRSGGTRSASKEDLDKAIVLTVVDEEDAKEEADILKGIVKFNEITVKQIMCNRVDVIGVDFDTSFRDVIQTIKDSGHSRLPIYKHDFDNVIGILYVKDLISHLDEPDGFEWQALMRNELLYVPESKKIKDLLREIQHKKMHMAIVVDEYGGSSGIVTLEDVMEEVLGEIKDESDLEENLEYMQLDDKNVIFEGKVLINDVCRVLDVDSMEFDMHRGESDTIAGLILEINGLLPKKDQEFILEDKYKLKVLSVGKRRIEQVQVTII